ncbi:MAG: UDP-N-acetylmuramate--L-alanine ligase [Acidobacteria bacterium]|nr:UDP-N-acetylmuramate--L-alanine ligase [Acidobacteriota bacterium]
MGKTENIHFVGIGGIGMSGIAEVLLNMGFKISGSDLKINPIAKRLVKLGATISEGHKAENISGTDVVVYSSAVDETNPEIAEAHRLQIPVIPRAEMLGELMRMKYSIAISGSHGKTSTTSLAANILHNAGLDPTFVVGGRLKIFDSNARLGGGDYLVAEADESDKSFLKLFPTLAVVTNIDVEHLDTYTGIEDIKDTFIQFLNKVPFFGAVIINIDDQHTQEIIPSLERRIITYGLNSQADIIASKVELKQFTTSFDVSIYGKDMGRIIQKIPGKHSVYNSLAAIAAGNEIGINFKEIQDALAKFENAERRVEVKGEVNGITILDDYGHHPTEIIATLKGLKEGWNRRIVAIFQPHRYSRTHALMENFQRAFYQSDIVFVTDIYPAGEKNIYGVDSKTLAEGIKKFGHKAVNYEPDKIKIADQVIPLLNPGDIVITLGAGDIWKIGEEIVEKLVKKGK